MFDWPAVGALFSKWDSQGFETGSIFPGLLFGFIPLFWGAPELEAFSFLHLLFAVSPLSHLVMLEAGFWVQLRSFLLTPLPFQETSCRTCSAGSCCEEMRLGVVVLSLVKGCVTS